LFEIEPFVRAFVLAIATIFVAGCPHHVGEHALDRIAPRIQSKIPATGTYHTVAEDETLSAIAKRYKVDLQHLAEVNDLKPPYTIRAQDRLFIPGSRTEENSLPRDSGEGPQVERFDGVLAWPVRGPIISQFGVRQGVQHNGITIAAPAGSTVRSAADGRVGHVGNIPGYGDVVLIEHANRLVTVYAHLHHIAVQTGKQVKQGEGIGTVGTSGRADAPCLYFEVRSRSQPRNPLFFLPSTQKTKLGTEG
jgi:murein DD-endopeptidase MepM/ murein hydrolase activator NlpD